MFVRAPAHCVFSALAHSNPIGIGPCGRDKPQTHRQTQSPPPRIERSSTGAPITIERTNPLPGRDGGIGRRAGLKNRLPQGSAGSSPALGTSRFTSISRSLARVSTRRAAQRLEVVLSPRGPCGSGKTASAYLWQSLTVTAPHPHKATVRLGREPSLNGMLASARLTREIAPS